MFDYEKHRLKKGIQGEQKRYVNYHHHTFYSNPIAGADSSISPISVIKRAIELGHTTVTTCEHGSSLSFLEYYGYDEFVKKDKDGNIKIDFRGKFNLVFAVEAYFVIDNLTKDKTNAHIILVAKNDKGRKAINRLCSNANEFGFYVRPRASLKDILSLPPDDVIVTTACLAGVWRYKESVNPYQCMIDDYNNYKNTFEKIDSSDNPEEIISICFKKGEYEEKRYNYEFVKKNKDIYKEYDYISILKMLKNHFKDNLYLEIQPHLTEKQIIVNKIIKQVSKELDIPLIAGCDSHANNDKDVKTREIFISSKRDLEINEDEIGWFVDYPDYETLKSRFLEQGIFSEEEIVNAIDKTLIFEMCDQPYISKDIKLPTIYPNLNQDEKNKLFENLIWELWEHRKNELIEFNRKWYNVDEVVPFDRYISEIKKELNVVIDTNMTDYFLFNYHMIKNAIDKYGGVLTKTGRGCFTSNSYISTNTGLKKISDIVIGDFVYNRYGELDKVIGTPTYLIEEELLRIHFQNKTVELTKDHRVLTSCFGKIDYKQAKDLTDNDYLLELDKYNKYKLITIEKIEKFNYKGYVYDLTIKNDPSYTVNGIVVHNSGGSFYLNNLLGFTSIDRIFEKVPMLSERFMSKSRILETRSLPDIDQLNILVLGRLL